MHSVEKREILSLTEKIFREINSLVTSLVKDVEFTKYLLKSVIVNFRNMWNFPASRILREII